MNICEAIRARTPGRPYLRRKSWEFRLTVDGSRRALLSQSQFRILPTDTPDGCLAVSMTDHRPRPSWAPMATDLLADDWEVV